MSGVSGFNASTLNISGGTLTNGLELFDSTAKANFVGTGFSYVYVGYGDNTFYGAYCDQFTISGFFAGASKSYQLYIKSGDGSGNGTTPNSAPRQFTFNGAAPAVVPEAGTLALLVPAFGVALAFVARRRR